MSAETKITAQPDPYLGRTFDGYRIDERIGHGGMGVVYKATQLSLNRPVAIKLLHDSALDQPQFRERFEREVDVLSKLAHPNIVTVLERGEIDGRPYLAMEYIAGASLRDVLKKGPLPPTEALVIVRGVLSALEHAHDKSIIHRDIKPENILVAPGGIVKVADFGLGRLMGPVDATRLDAHAPAARHVRVHVARAARAQQGSRPARGSLRDRDHSCTRRSPANFRSATSHRCRSSGRRSATSASTA